MATMLWFFLRRPLSLIRKKPCVVCVNKLVFFTFVLMSNIEIWVKYRLYVKKMATVECDRSLLYSSLHLYG